MNSKNTIGRNNSRNSAMVNEDGTTSSHQPICMGREQATAAASILKCRFLVPIHYETFCNPLIYNETDTPINRLINSKRNFEFNILSNKEEFML